MSVPYYTADAFIDEPGFNIVYQISISYGLKHKKIFVGEVMKVCALMSAL